jgi:excisionase family DNA binding protein
MASVSDLRQTVSLSELAAYLRISRQALRVWMQQGRAPRHIRVRNTVRFRREEIERWLSQEEDASASDPQR